MVLTKLINSFLIATPSLHDTIFKKSIILLCDHSKKGSMGLILNKPMIEDKDWLLDRIRIQLYVSSFNFRNLF